MQFAKINSVIEDATANTLKDTKAVSQNEYNAQKIQCKKMGEKFKTDITAAV
jgi:hypothetical protein